MASQGRFVRSAVKYGVRYGPVVFEAVKHGREPAQLAVQAAWAKRTARRKAAEHAATVRSGSILKVIDDGATVYFVFSGDEIIATYPPVPQASYGDLLRHSDLAKRVTAEELAARRPKVPVKLPRRR